MTRPIPPRDSLRASELARLAGVSTDTLRHYERKGLIPRPPRGANGYREYPTEALDRVRLVRSALAVGFTLDELSGILGARERGGVPCRRAHALLEEKLASVESKLRELEGLRETLRAVLGQWNERLSEVPDGAQARLLESLPRADVRSPEARTIQDRRRSRS